MSTIINKGGVLHVLFEDGTCKAIGQQTNLYAVNTNRFYFIGEGWTDCYVELTDAQISMFVACIGGQHKTKKIIRNYLSNPYRIPRYSYLFERLLIEPIGDDQVRCSYCAGQDYVAETQTIRKAILNR
jgi:hypothetical protein